MMGQWSFYFGVVPLTVIVGALALLWTLRSDTVKVLVRKAVGLEIELEDVNLGFMMSPLVVIVQLKGLTIYTPDITEEETKAPADRVTAHVPDLKLWLERTPLGSHQASLTVEAIDCSINYVYVTTLSTETNFDRIIKALGNGTEAPQDISNSASLADPDEAAAAVASDINGDDDDSDEAVDSEGREEPGGDRRRGLLSVRKILLQAPTRVYVRGGGVPLMVPLNLGSVLIDPAALRGRPAALFVWINQRILLAIANSGVDLVAGVGRFSLNAVEAGADAVAGGGAALIEAAGDGVRSMGDGVRSVIAGAEGAFEGAFGTSTPPSSSSRGAAASDGDGDGDGGKIEKGNPFLMGLGNTGRALLHGIGNTNRALSRSCQNVGRVFNCDKNENEEEEEGDPAAAAQTQQTR